MKIALDSMDELKITQTLLDLVELPSRALLRYCPESKQHPAAPSPRALPDFIPDPLPSIELPDGNANQKNAKRKAYQDLLGKAMQCLLTNGTAPRTEATLKILETMHRKSEAALIFPAMVEDQERVSVSRAKKHLFKVASAEHTCMDVFGWAADLMEPVRGTRFIQ